MKAFMTKGTIDFLLKLIDKHSDLDFKLMHNNEGGLLYYEHKRKKVFQAGRNFEIIEESGNFKESGYVVMKNFPVPEESQPIVESRIKEGFRMLEIVPGFQAFRFLRPIKGDVYVIVTQWATKRDLERWKETDIFSEGHQTEKGKSSTYFFQNSYTALYKMYEEEEE